MWTRFLLAALLAWAALPASAQEREWIFDTGDEDAYLVFGVPDSDDAGVSFGCTLQSGEIRIFVPEAGDYLKPNDKIKLVITIAGKDFTFDATTTANEMSATTSAEAEIRPDDATLWYGPYHPTELVLGDPGARDAALHAIQACIPHRRILLEGADFDSLIRACSKS